MKKLLTLFCILTIFWSNNLNAQCTIVVDSVSYPGICDGRITVIPIGGVPPYTIIWWDNNITNIIPPQWSTSRDSLCAGTYYLEVYDSNGFPICTSYPIIYQPQSVEILDISKNENKLIKIINILGQEISCKNNKPLFYIYNDGKIEKKIIIE